MAMKKCLCILSFIAVLFFSGHSEAEDKYTGSNEENDTVGNSGREKTEEPLLLKKEEDAGCESKGDIKQLIIEPKRVELGPSEQVCFKAMSIDETGCKEAVKPQWFVFQDSYPIRGLMTKSGCFVAGDTAANSEGLYGVTARYQGKMSFAEVRVVFPNISDLVSARLKPVEKSTLPTDSDVKSRSSEDRPVLPNITVEKSTGLWKWIVGAIFGIILVALVLFSFFYFRRGKFYSPFAEINRSIQGEANTCPKCKNKYSWDARFCPEDGSRLVAESMDQEKNSISLVPKDGKICPKCQRGYDMSAGYCPHDSAILISYSEWRLKNKTGI